MSAMAAWWNAGLRLNNRWTLGEELVDREGNQLTT